jgi:hypothetical protein
MKCVVFGEDGSVFIGEIWREKIHTLPITIIRKKKKTFLNLLKI